MFPFGGLLGAPSFELKVPGQDSPATIVGVGSGNAYAGVRFNPSGFMEQTKGVFVSWGDPTVAPLDGDMWISGDAKDPDLFDPADYEARYTSVTGDIGNLSSSGINVWVPVTSTPFWRVRAIGINAIDEVSGIIQVRKITDPSNTLRSGNLTLRAIRIDV